jgi:asparaginyl-tRNA synthetase
MPTLRTRTPLYQLFKAPTEYVGRVLGVACWVRDYRTAGGGKFAFAKVFDGTTGHELQVVINGQLPNFAKVNKSCSLFVVGQIVVSKGREQAVEMVATSVEVTGECNQETYPLAGKNHSLEYLRNQGHLRPRTLILGAVARIRSALAYATHKFFQERAYQYVHTPLITASDCEGGGEMFQVTTLLENGTFCSFFVFFISVELLCVSRPVGVRAARTNLTIDFSTVHTQTNNQITTGKLKATKEDGTADYSEDFFNRPAYLTVSGQLNAEIMATALSSVYTFGPTFRAENSHTKRHLSEFWMIEPEICFADLTENMDIVESFLQFVMQYVLDKCDVDLARLEAYETRNGK